LDLNWRLGGAIFIIMETAICRFDAAQIAP